MKPLLSLHVSKASHFLSWELPYFKQFFQLTDHPQKDAILFVFGPDALSSGALLPAKFRVALLFPGFGYNPYHDLIHRYGMRRIIDDAYDLIFVNPGPIYEAFKDSPKVRLCPFSVNIDLINVRNYRTKLEKLIHISANSPQKDWTRSRDVMRLSGLKYQVYPPRNITQPALIKLNSILEAKRLIRERPLFKYGYKSHKQIVEKYHQYDGFVHIAAEIPGWVDGKYTATLLEAGLTGCILFWHDTLGLGNNFETIFDLPIDPSEAASEILEIQKSVDIKTHSKRTSEEIYERVNPKNVMQIRFDAIMELLT